MDWIDSNSVVNGCVVSLFTLHCCWNRIGLRRERFVTRCLPSWRHLQIHVFFFFWASCSNHCLAARDLGAGVEQPFNCLIVQHRQAMQSVGRRWIEHWRTTWSTVCSSVPHSQAAEEAIHHLYKHKQKRPTLVRRLSSRTLTLLGRVIPGWWAPVTGMKMWSLVGLSVHSAYHWQSAHCVIRMLLLSAKLMRCCAAGTNRCLDLRRRASTRWTGERWVEQMSRLHGTVF